MEYPNNKKAKKGRGYEESASKLRKKTRNVIA